MPVNNGYEKKITKKLQGLQESETVYVVSIVVCDSEGFFTPLEEVELFYSLAEAERFAENYVPPKDYNFSSLGCYITIRDKNIR